MYATDPSGRSSKPVRARRVSASPDAAEDGYRVRAAGRDTGILARIGIIFSGFLLAAMILFTLTGYERITRAYADVNTLNSAIDETNLRIAALDVQIECAVTIRDAQDAAERFGMQYPSPSQYVRVGDYIPTAVTTLPTDAFGMVPDRSDAVNPPVDNVGSAVNPPVDNVGVVPADPDAGFED